MCAVIDRAYSCTIRRFSSLSAAASPRADKVEEHAFVVVPQVGQVIGEVAEVVARADLQVLAEVAIDRGQRAGAALIDIREVEHSSLDQALPTFEEAPVEAQHAELSGIVKELPQRAIRAHLPQAIGVLAADGPVRGDVEGKIESADVALLNKLRRGVL